MYHVIENFQGMYEHPSTIETLKTIKQKHDESLRDYVKYFCNIRNAILYIQDIDIINAFHDGVNNIKIVEIAMKKLIMVDDLLAIADICIEASKPGLDFLSLVTRGPRRRSRTIKKSTRLTGEIARITETVDTTETASSSHQIRRRRGISVVLTMRRSGARSIVP
jgi:hypothetical protein